MYFPQKECARHSSQTPGKWYTGLYIYMTSALNSSSARRTRNGFKVDAQELILSSNERYVCETYIFEPGSGEEPLGYLFAAAETEDRGGVGKELVDVVIAAIQREYFRDRERGAVQSFEQALHQANLILHEAAERGVRDWMGYFHVAVGALVGNQLHVSVAGLASVWIARKTSMTCISEGLSHLPITNPLRTFSQVASGDIMPRDTLLFATGNFDSVFRPQDVARFTIDHSAATISARLQQLYTDMRQDVPVAVVTVSVLPDYVVQPREEMGPSIYRPPREAASASPESLRPRKPIIIRRAGWQMFFLAILQGLQFIWRSLVAHAWPLIKQGSQKVGSGVTSGGVALFHMSKRTGTHLAQSSSPLLKQGVQSLSTSFSPKRFSFSSFVSKILTFFKQLPAALRRLIFALPVTSKVFGVVALVLLVVLVVSLRSLQHKRAVDSDIQRAAELLHEAQTKQEAAATALIYDNRDQAQSLLDEAKRTANELSGSGFYEAETRELQGKIEEQMDRLQKITRLKNGQARVLGTFTSVAPGADLRGLFFLSDTLYTFNPASNAILAMDTAGQARVVSEETKEIGFFTGGIAHVADKTVLLATQDPGLALFDTKDTSLIRQDITLPSTTTSLDVFALFGNRLYLLDAATKNILTYNKTLRGYGSGTPWITDTTFPADTIKSLAVDGSIYTLHTDGSIRELFKGAPTDLAVDAIEPSLRSATKIITTEDLKLLYVLDSANQRVVVLTKQGALVRQIFFESTVALRDIALSPNEETLYVLDGAQILAVSLVEATPTPTSP